MWLPCFEYIWPLNGRKMSWYSACLLLLFSFRTNSKKGQLDENGFRHCYGNFLKVALWKLLDHSYVESPFSTNTRNFDNRILKDTQQVFILRTWINMRAKSFIKTSVNVTETGIDKGTQNAHLEEHCTKIETTFHLFYALLFLTNMVSIGFFFLTMSTTIYFSAFWLTFVSLILKFIQCLRLFYKEQ